MSHEPEAPSDHAGKVEELSAKFHEIYQLEAKRQGDVRHKDAYADLAENAKEFDRVLARYILSLLDAECKAAVASALEQAAEASCQLCVAGLEVSWDRTPVEVPEYGQPGTWWHRLTSGRGHDRCAASAIRALSPDPNYIALREAEARIGTAIKLHLMSPDSCCDEGPCFIAKELSALTEARDKSAKK